ncbi:MAG: DUF1549 and DUF1553 domain-containing protein [Planctomycetaceae bacterium]
MSATTRTTGRAAVAAQSESAPAPQPPAAAAATTPAVVTSASLETANPVVVRFGGSRLDLWSLRPIATVSLPDLVGASPVDAEPGRDVRDGSSSTPAGQAIDRFIDQQLSPRRLTRSPRADLRTLARRAAFTLTGLPPSPSRVRELVADPNPEAFARYVEELLASPRFGEHWARLWLDVVRYSDSNGFDWDEFRPQAWRFRDYVVESLNADKSFAQFVLEQLAGDELFAGPPQDTAQQQALIATGFLRLGPHDNAAPLFNEQDRSRAELLADLVETTGSAFLGLTLACCRCHDHKHDPLLQADHFRLRAFFAGVQPADDRPIDLAPVQAEVAEHNAQLEQELTALGSQRDQLLEGVRQRLRARGKAQPSDAELDAALTADERTRREEQQRRESELRGRQRSFTHALLMSDATGDQPATHVLFQGDHRAPREVVEPGFLTLLDPRPAEVAPGPNPATAGRRLALARWIVAPANPLTRRVLVNRVWQALFGQGLVATPNDFGLAGAPPTHPELLDWLAGEFLRSGWSLKSLVRQIVLSETWQQVSFAPLDALARDADNAWLGRQNLRRLSAEQVRDALLATSGRLTPQAGGPPVWPNLPAEILQANPAFLDDNETRTKGWYPSPDEQQFCRSLFLVQKRGVRIPFLETFDLPENSLSCGRRTASTVAPQALSLLNSDLAVAAASGLAQRVVAQAGDDPDRQVAVVFDLALQRDPDGTEREVCGSFLARRSLVELCRAILNLNEFLYVD